MILTIIYFGRGVLTRRIRTTNPDAAIEAYTAAGWVVDHIVYP